MPEVWLTPDLRVPLCLSVDLTNKYTLIRFRETGAQGRCTFHPRWVAGADPFCSSGAEVANGGIDRTGVSRC